MSFIGDPWTLLEQAREKGLLSAREVALLRVLNEPLPDPIGCVRFTVGEVARATKTTAADVEKLAKSIEKKLGPFVYLFNVPRLGKNAWSIEGVMEALERELEQRALRPHAHDHGRDEPCSLHVQTPRPSARGPAPAAPILRGHASCALGRPRSRQPTGSRRSGARECRRHGGAVHRGRHPVS